MLKITIKIGVLLSILIGLLSCQKDIPNTAKMNPKTGEIIDRSVNMPSENPKLLEYEKYKGAWFDIEYPKNFTVKNSQKSSTRVDGFDSAIFSSSDGKVQFYVFSPQWSGNPKDISLKSSETQIPVTTQIENGLEVKRWTIKSKDGSYSRSYESTSETDSKINKVFGIHYSNEKDLAEYRNQYLHFKNSLQQFAD